MCKDTLCTEKQGLSQCVLAARKVTLSKITTKLSCYNSEKIEMMEIACILSWTYCPNNENRNIAGEYKEN